MTSWGDPGSNSFPLDFYIKHWEQLFPTRIWWKLHMWGTYWSFLVTTFCLCVVRVQLCPTLCDPMDGSLPSSSVHGIFQTRTLEWVATSLSSGSSWPRDWTHISCIAGRFFTCWVISIAHKKIFPIGFLCPQLHHTWGSKKSWQQCMISLVVIRSSNKKVEWSN